MGRKADGVAVRTGECDICLEHALARRCCGGVFCAHCYGEKAHCPQCGVPVVNGEPDMPVAAEKHGEKKEAEGGEGEGFVLDALDEAGQKRLEAQEDAEECRCCLEPG